MSCNKWLGSYVTDTLVETGSGLGDGIQKGLDFGFKKIYSVEIDHNRFMQCKNRFKDYPQVTIYEGPSVDWMDIILANINTKATFLLDSHVMSLSQTHDKELICPLLEELKLIMEHSQKLNLHHFILVDDAKYLNGKTQTFGNYSQRDILEICKLTFPPYSMEHKGRYFLLS